MSGESVRLRTWQSDDADFVYDLYSRWDVQRYLGHEPKIMSRIDEAQALIERLNSRGDEIQRHWAVVAAATDSVVGTVML